MTSQATRRLNASIHAGVRATGAVAAAGALYAVATPELEHRTALLLVTGVAALWALLIGLVPIETIVRGRYAGAFFVGWSFASVMAIAAAVAVDPSADAPFAVAFVLPLIFAALAYPPRMLVPVAALAAVACAGTLALATDRPLASVAFTTVVVVMSGYLCAWHARAHQRHRDELAQLSRTDELTGCLNRRGFEAELATRVARQLRYGTPFGLVLLDLDGFKRVNDDDGHAAGDAVLRGVATAAAGATRAGDAVCRIGGDEFAVLLDAGDPAEVQLAALRIAEDVRAHIAVSVGFATSPHDAVDPEALYKRADALMYEAKRLAHVR